MANDRRNRQQAGSGPSVAARLRRQAARLAAHREWIRWGLARLKEEQRPLTATGTIRMTFNLSDLTEMDAALTDAMAVLDDRARLLEGE